MQLTSLLYVSFIRLFYTSLLRSLRLLYQQGAGCRVQDVGFSLLQCLGGINARVVSCLFLESSIFRVVQFQRCLVIQFCIFRVVCFQSCVVIELFIFRVVCFQSCVVIKLCVFRVVQLQRCVFLELCIFGVCVSCISLFHRLFYTSLLYVSFDAYMSLLHMQAHVDDAQAVFKNVEMEFRSLSQVLFLGHLSRSLFWVPFLGPFSRSLLLVFLIDLLSRSLSQVPFRRMNVSCRILRIFFCFFVGFFDRSVQVSFVGLFSTNECPLSNIEDKFQVPFWSLLQVSSIGLLYRPLPQVSSIGLLYRPLPQVSSIGLLYRSLIQASSIGLFYRSLMQASSIGLFYRFY